MQPITSSRSDSKLFLAYQSSRAGSVLFGEVWGGQERSWQCSCVAASLCCNPQRSHLCPPKGFHFKSPAFVQKCICSLILFGNCVKQKRANGEWNHSVSLPAIQPHPSLSLSLCPPTLALPRSPSLAVHILLQMLMTPPPTPSVF